MWEVMTHDILGSTSFKKEQAFPSSKGVEEEGLSFQLPTRQVRLAALEAAVTWMQAGNKTSASSLTSSILASPRSNVADGFLSADLREKEGIIHLGERRSDWACSIEEVV